MFPKGNNQSELLSIYLEFADLKDSTVPRDVYCCAQFVIVVSRPSDPTSYQIHCKWLYLSHRLYRYSLRVVIFLAAQHRFNAEEADWGFTRFIELRRLYQADPQTGETPFIEDDALRITCLVRVVEDPTGVLWHNFIKYVRQK